MLKRTLLFVCLFVLLLTPQTFAADGDRVIEGIMADSISTKMLEGDTHTETLTGNKTLTTSDVMNQRLDPNGSDRDVTLPPEASSTDLTFYIYNSADGAGEDLVIKNDTPATIVTLGPGMGMPFSCDGTNWVAVGDDGITYDAQGNTINMGSAEVITTGPFNSATVNTGQGANELYAMDQDVETTSSPAFVTTDLTGVTDNNIPKMGASGFEDSALSDVGSGVVAYDSSRSITDMYHLADKRYVDEAVTALGARYYMLNTASGESDYKLCSASAPGGGEQSVSGASLSDDDYVQGWIAPNTNEPDKLLLGVYNWRIYAEKTGGTETLRLYWKLVERKNDDSEVVIATSVVSNEITSGKNSYIIPLTLSADHDIASDSYVVGKIYADVSGSGSAPSVTLYYEGDSHSHWQIPVNTEIFNNIYVNIDGDTMTGDLDMDGNYFVQSQSVADLASKGPSYWFDGVDDKIIIPDNADINFASGDFSIIASTKTVSTKGLKILGKGVASSTANGYSIAMNSNGQVFVILGEDNARHILTSSTDSFNDGAEHIFGVTFDRDENCLLFVDGVVVAADDISTFTGTTTIGTDLYIGTYGDGTLDLINGQISRTLLFNLALTEDEVKYYSSGGEVPYKYQGASQDELMPNQVDRDFSGASAWGNVDLNAYDETTDLTITATAADQYCTLPVASAPTTVGKRYRMTFDVANIVSTWTVQSFDGTQTLGTISANGTGQSIEWTATTTGGYRLVAAADNSSGDFDNFTLTQIGCVLDLNPSGIGHNQWQDASGNQLVGNVNGAVPVNLPVDAQETYLDLTVTGDTSFTLPKGYQVKSIVFKSDGAIGGGLDVGVTNGGGELVNACAIGGAVTVLATLVPAYTIGETFTTADDTLYVTDADGTGWDGATVELRVQMQRLTTN